MPSARTLVRTVGALSVAALLQACAGAPSTGGDGAPAPGAAPPIPPDAVPRHEPRSRYGNPPSYVVFGKRYHVMDSGHGYVERGVASWYGTKFHGRRTSSGEPYDMHLMTAAHKSLPLPSYVQVTNLRNGRSTVVRVNDRGPFHDNRIIDLSYAAARKLDIVRDGTGLVEVRALSPGAAPSTSEPVLVPVSSPAPPPHATPTWTAAGAPPSPGGAPTLFLQAGAFSDPGNAHRLRLRLASIDGTPVFVEEVLAGGQRLHRVRLGPLGDVDEADRLSARIVDAGMDLPRIVIE